MSVERIHPSELGSAEVINDFRLAFENKRDNPDDPDDPYFGLYAEAGLRELENKDTQIGLRWLAEIRSSKQEKAGYLANFILRHIQKGRVQEGEFGSKYPVEYQDIESWQKLIRDSVVHHKYDFEFDARARTIQSNIDLRYVNVKLLSLSQEGRFSECSPTVLDIGCSRNHGLKRLARNQIFKFEDLSVLESPFDDNKKVKNTVDTGSSSFLNKEFVQTPFTLAPSLGVDMWPIRDDRTKEWVQGCSFYPQEAADAERMAMFKDLEETVVEWVEFAQADAKRGNEFTRATDGKKFDIVVLSTILYMLSDADRSQIIKNAVGSASDDGYLMVLDSVDADDKNETGLKFPPYFYSEDRPFGYKTLVMDMKQKEKGFQELFRWENGRCKVLIPNMDNEIVKNILAV